MDDGSGHFPPEFALAGESLEVEGQERAVVGLDDAVEVGHVDVVASEPRVVEPAEPAGHLSLDPPLSEEKPERVRPAGEVVLRVGEADPVQRLEPHRAASLSTYFATTSTSRFTSSPSATPPSVVTSRVCGMSATVNELSPRPAIVRLTPSTAMEPFSTQ